MSTLGSYGSSYSHSLQSVKDRVSRERQNLQVYGVKATEVVDKLLHVEDSFFLID